MSVSIHFDQAQSNAFYQTVKRRVTKYFSDSGKTRYADGLIVVKAVVFVGLISTSYALILTNPFDAAWPLLPLAMVYGVSTLLLAINVAHDAVHHALTPNKTFNHVVHVFAFSLLGVDGDLWQLRHNQAHHMHANVKDCDSAITRNGLLRLSPHQPWQPHHRYQYLYAPLAYAIMALHSTFRQDFLYLFNVKQLANLGPIDYPRRQYVLFALSKLIYITLALVLPLVFIDLPWWQILAGFVLMTSVVSTFFVFLLIGTHFCEETEFFEVDEQGNLPHNWAYHSMVTSCDWSPYSRVAHFLLGGANSHATHHLFPNVCHTHYPAIAHLIEETAGEFGVPYHRLTLGQMIRSHFRFLKSMGRVDGSMSIADETSLTHV